MFLLQTRGNSDGFISFLHLKQLLTFDLGKVSERGTISKGILIVIGYLDLAFFQSE